MVTTYFVTIVQNFIKGQLCALRRQYLVPSAVQSLLVQSASLKGKAKQSKCPNWDNEMASIFQALLSHQSGISRALLFLVMWLFFLSVLGPSICSFVRCILKDLIPCYIVGRLPWFKVKPVGFQSGKWPHDSTMSIGQGLVEHCCSWKCFLSVLGPFICSFIALSTKF